MLRKIISGGQTGVDRAALEVALQLGLDCGGWCPRGRRAEDGPIHERYPLQETSWHGYPQRTRYNVRDSDATLILTHGPVDGGTALTVRLAEKLIKPYLVVDLNCDEVTTQDVARWLTSTKIVVLNVAGPRESSQPGIYDAARTFLLRLLPCEQPITRLA